MKRFFVATFALCLSMVAMPAMADVGGIESPAAIHLDSHMDMVLPPGDAIVVPAKMAEAEVAEKTKSTYSETTGLVGASLVQYRDQERLNFAPG